MITTPSTHYGPDLIRATVGYEDVLEPVSAAPKPHATT